LLTTECGNRSENHQFRRNLDDFPSNFINRLSFSLLLSRVASHLHHFTAFVSVFFLGFFLPPSKQTHFPSSFKFHRFFDYNLRNYHKLGSFIVSISHVVSRTKLIFIYVYQVSQIFSYTLTTSQILSIVVAGLRPLVKET
jgi:hypothetical protein